MGFWDLNRIVKGLRSSCVGEVFEVPKKMFLPKLYVNHPLSLAELWNASKKRHL